MGLRLRPLGPPALNPIANNAQDPARLDRAVNGLADWRGDLSARELLWPSQLLGLAIAVAAAALIVVHGGDTARALLPWLLAAPFLVSALIRLAALHLVHSPADADAGTRQTAHGPVPGGLPGGLAGAPPGDDLPAGMTDADLPSYTILVPLYREEGVAPQIVDAVMALDYPAHKLQVLVIVEAADPATRATILAARRLPDHMRFVVVPDGQPRTKPRALNYALAEATGDLVVVYDAEDIPEPDQLRHAAAAFARDPGIGCLQARLNIYNTDESWLTRQFTMEYTALFDALLPTVARLGWPVPLGGTSNHFPRRVLLACGGWDPFNVTEDADLGVRLARLGWRVGMLPSTTWEEAPASWHVWSGQRSRWIKGWMQTWLVHSRRPGLLWRELGAWGAAGFHLWSAAVLISALLHPWVYVAMLWQVAADAPGAGPEGGGAMGWLAAANLAAGYLSAMALGRVAVARRKLRLEAVAWSLPLYWLAISIAAHRALVELVLAPSHWEKTEHRGGFTRSGGDGAGPEANARQG